VLADWGLETANSKSRQYLRGIVILWRGCSLLLLVVDDGCMYATSIRSGAPICLPIC
jgi:hypothetical protein